VAEDLVRIDEDAGDDPDRDDEQAVAPYQSRFQLLFGVLLGVGMAAIVATVLVLGSAPKGQDTAAVSWAPWHPTSSDGLTAVKEIAQHVGDRYTLPSGHQLVAVTGSPLEYAQLPATIAISARGQYTIFDGPGVTYTLCGEGKNCSISEGKPTNARFLVLRREALELALYTFRYIKDINEVVAYLPPAPGAQATYAMFFSRDQVQPNLDQPLTATLGAGAPPVPPKVSAASAHRMDALTAPHLYLFRAQVGEDAHPIVFLSPVTG
jgi:hypothetical protein